MLISQLLLAAHYRNNMIATIQSVLPALVVAFDIVLVVAFLALVFRHTFGRNLARFMGKHALLLGIFVAFIAIAGSLFYSNGVGFEPCYLCWWQRVAIYPMLALFFVGYVKKDRGAFSYVLPLSLMGLVLSLYHAYIQWGGNPLIPCEATASCAKLYVYAYGYVTIPTMSLTIIAAILLLYWANKVYEHRHA